MMERGLRSQLKIYDDFSMCSYKQMEELIDKINAIRCQSFLLKDLQKQSQEIWEREILEKSGVITDKKIGE